MAKEVDLSFASTDDLLSELMNRFHLAAFVGYTKAQKEGSPVGWQTAESGDLPQIIGMFEAGKAIMIDRLNLPRMNITRLNEDDTKPGLPGLPTKPFIEDIVDEED